MITIDGAPCKEVHFFKVNNDGRYTKNFLYIPNNTSIVIGCKCRNKNESPQWFYSNMTEISDCDENTTVICSETKVKISNLILSPFTKSLARNYTCSVRNFKIRVLG